VFGISQSLLLFEAMTWSVVAIALALLRHELRTAYDGAS
jgi:hypothetical protein